MKTYAFRLKPGEDLKEGLENIITARNLRAGIVLSAVGSLKKATLRLADESTEKTYEGKFEITSLIGTLSQDGVHIHILISDAEGKTIGGHLKKGCVIYTTAEVVIGELEGFVFSRKMDPRTGFKELIIEEK
jgi:predicted DNA-binding protein with PD1-like motif